MITTIDTRDTPDLGVTGADLYQQTAPMTYAEPDTGYAWAQLLGALAILLDPVAEMVRDDDAGNPGWTAQASPARCPTPWLRVLAQWAGIRASQADAMSEADLRELIGPHAPGMWRGTRAAMEAAVRRFMPDDAPEPVIYFEERAGGDPYLLRVFTYDFIDHDPALVQAALQAAKPAGLILSYELRHGQTYAMLAQHGDYADVKATYLDYASMFAAEPRSAR